MKHEHRRQQADRPERKNEPKALQEKKNHEDAGMGTPSLLFPSVITSTPQHQEQLRKKTTRDRKAPAQGAIIGEPLAPETCTTKVVFSANRRAAEHASNAEERHVRNSESYGHLMEVEGGGEYLRSCDLCVAHMRAGACVCVTWCGGHGSVRKFHGMFSIRIVSGSQRTGK